MLSDLREEVPPTIREWTFKLAAKPKYVVSSTRTHFPWTNTHHLAGHPRRPLLLERHAEGRDSPDLVAHDSRVVKGTGMLRAKSLWTLLPMLTLLASVAPSRASDGEVEELKRAVRQMQEMIDALNRKIEKLEAGSAAPVVPPAAQAPATPKEKKKEEPIAEMPEPSGEAALGYAANVLSPQGVGSQQAIAPDYRGFFRVPSTKALIRFNAKPRVDFTFDTDNAGDDNRFIPGKIPVSGDPAKGGGTVFNVNGKGSQLIIDLRAPTMSGSPRFYFQNDFYGSGGGEFDPRMQQFWGSIYDVTVGQTFSPFEDPDIWPDTVDYEGPNSMIFARFPLVRYKLNLNNTWALNGGVTQPESQVSDFDGELVESINHAPDFAFNVRGESEELGHVQLGSVFRIIGARSESFGSHEVFGWGLNLSGTLNVPVPWGGGSSDLLGAQLTYGEGLGRYGNDSSFFDTDAAFDSRGSLEALPYFGAFVGYTHRWLPDWRSTATYGYVNVDSKGTQGPDAYHQTQYVSLNLIWQLRERLSVGIEGLYGDNQKESGASGDVFRTQVGVAYSLF